MRCPLRRSLYTYIHIIFPSLSSYQYNPHQRLNGTLKQHRKRNQIYIRSPADRQVSAPCLKQSPKYISKITIPNQELSGLTIKKCSSLESSN